MKLSQVMEKFNLELRVAYYGRWVVQFRGVDIKDRGLLKDEYGNGDTLKEALTNYLESVSGLEVVYYAIGRDRRVFTLPFIENDSGIND